MKYKNNLSDLSTNSYFEVVKPFHVYIPVGNYESNVSVGSTKLLGTLYRSVLLQPSDYLYDLYGGVFVTYQGKMHPAKINIPDGPPLSKLYSNTENYPVDNLKKIDKPSSNFDYVISVPLVTVPNKFHGDGIDSIES